MKKKLTFHTILAMILTGTLVCLMSCNDNEETPYAPTPLHIEKTSYEVMQHGVTPISIINGSGDFTLTVSNDKLLTASFTPVKAADHLGFIYLRGLLKGETSITVTDNVTHDTQILNAKVTDTYLACPITWSNHPAIASDLVLYFVNNTERTCYFFSKDNLAHTLSSQPIVRGIYRFYVDKDEEGQPSLCLALSYPSDENGNFTDATIPPTEHNFSIKCGNMTLLLIKEYLNVDWESMIGTAAPRMPNPQSTQLTLKEIGTEYVIETANLDSTPQIPEGILE